jgi:Flp pilus assembly pilin Flp
MKQLISQFIRDEQGQDLIEYALLGSFVSFAAYGGAKLLGEGYKAWFTDMDTAVDAAAGKIPDIE